MLPVPEVVEEYWEATTEYVSTISVPSLARAKEIGEKWFSDLTRFGPSPGVSIPGLGAFEVPAPPPAPVIPPAIPWYKENSTLIIAGAAGVGTIGVGLMLKYTLTNKKKKRKESPDLFKIRREIVVVLGADTTSGPALVHSLEKKGYVVIASVSTTEAVELLEKKSKGFVKALVLNPKEPASLTYFLRSFQAAIAIRYPINVAGDPYLPAASSSTINVLVSVVSLLSLATNPPPAPLEKLDISQTYIPLLYETHLAPLAIVQSILPHFRISVTRQGAGKTSVIVLVPAVASRVGVAFDGAKAMAVAGLVKGVEILRREVAKEINVVLVDVGAIGVVDEITDSQKEDLDIIALTKAWSASEKKAYGTAYEAAVESTLATENQSPDGKKKKRRLKSRRNPEDVDVLVSAVISVVAHGRSKRLSPSAWWNHFKVWLRGSRFGVGAGAHTYVFASFLPNFLLDALLELPTWLVELKLRFLPMPPPPLRPPSTATSSVPAGTIGAAAGRKLTRGGLPKAFIEGADEDPVGSTAPASSLSGGSRRESIASAESEDARSASLADSLISETSRTSIGEGRRSDPTQRIADSWVSVRDSPVTE